MIPIRDNIRPSTKPVVSWAIIGACIAVHIAQMLDQSPPAPYLTEWAVVPRNLIDPGAWLDAGIVRVFGSLVASQFLHGDILHLASNMLFLWVFGDNVEDRLGHVRFAFFYLACGIIAALVQSLLTWFPKTPMLGASGAIAGVLGAYFVLFKGAWVRSVVLIFIFPIFVDIPALLFIGLWFILQTANALYSIGPLPAAGGAGVAFAAHAAGFVAGILLLRLFIPRRAQPNARVVRWEVE